MAKAKSHPLKSITFSEPHPVGGWTNPSEKKCSSSWVISPISGSKLKNLEVNHHQSSPKFQSNYIVIIKITKNNPKIITQDVINSSQPTEKRLPLGLPTAGVMGVGGSGVVGISLREKIRTKNTTDSWSAQGKFVIEVVGLFCFVDFFVLDIAKILVALLSFIVTVVKSNEIKPDLKG